MEVRPVVTEKRFVVLPTVCHADIIHTTMFPIYASFTGPITLCGSWLPLWFHNSNFFWGGGH
jgi:hypothetical protein